MADEAATTAGSDQAGSAASSNGTASGGRTFTQDEVNAILAREKGSIQRKYEDYDDLKARAARADELEQSQQTETDKLRSKAEREAEKRAASEERAQQATLRAETALKRAAVVAAAATMNAADPHDVFTLLDKGSLSLDENDNVIGAEEAVRDLLRQKPHLLKRAGGFDSGQQGVSSTSARSMTDAIREAAGFSGRSR